MIEFVSELLFIALLKLADMNAHARIIKFFLENRLLTEQLALNSLINFRFHPVFVIIPELLFYYTDRRPIYISLLPILFLTNNYLIIRFIVAELCIQMLLVCNNDYKYWNYIRAIIIRFLII
jgi:hypothetical protein